MTRFSGKVGYVTEEREDGVVENVATERTYKGDELRNTRFFAQGDSTLGKITFQTRISVVADAYALENYEDIRYVVGRSGTPWIVESATVERPRLILLLGDRYTGPRAVEEDPDV